MINLELFNSREFTLNSATIMAEETSMCIFEPSRSRYVSIEMDWPGSRKYYRISRHYSVSLFYEDEF